MLTDLTKRSATTLYVVGGLAVVYGLISCFWPGITTLSFVIMWGVYALIDGIGSLIGAFTEKQNRAWSAIIGVIGILAGLLAILRPGLSLATIGWVLGFWLLVRGIAEFIAAFAQPGIGQKVLFALGGVFWFIAGVLTVANPLEATVAWTFWLGLLAIGWGVALLVAGLTLPKQDAGATA